MENACYSKKTGILGGTFNPIHTGHLMLAENAMEYCGLDEVLIMPSGCSYFKDQNVIASKEMRIKMTELAIEDNEKFKLSTIETDREGNSYTYETMEMLCRNNPDVHYYYIIGADTLFSIETWRKPEEIFKRCTIVCAKRCENEDDSMKRKAEELTARYDADIILMDIPAVPISSTMIRTLMSKGMSCRYYLDDKVIRYIKENGLYGYKRRSI
ncbi:MAG: nicotinate-nucleotide adenylyltransferase [Lachnospiraceae bacterium]|nr:nicotinate-nucleotide adenylyltransferase [Lachnospiraceae bacterium]